MNDLTYRVVLTDTPDAVLAKVPSVPGCSTYGFSRQAAIDNTEQILRGQLAHLLKSGQSFPLDNKELSEYKDADVATISLNKDVPFMGQVYANNVKRHLNPLTRMWDALRGKSTFI